MSIDKIGVLAAKKIVLGLQENLYTADAGGVSPIQNETPRPKLDARNPRVDSEKLSLD
ncbi:hypothetical protein SERLA73DRAFT_127551 [Serpula lacrymans var. lacrymans S7.3]|uniref:Uncharacterized protein n=2 Tax=Serpula lacrymans var. lacrymans TaxID=341189 RepID=F8QH20_SERL3|nr:uncharacterized protein SERLADRAFT_375163 [Serpula lacrymans var. lacrymans S7.9]EGN92421.1 hypothetical protein SERLA73DRAFT_127551 [Serpula lacrymans var. lacrymans S7.3]EGO18465.1 hypothetical protein SERLADRAFT_375163 [Serpula lacrymans var. lacrymans S7.9]